jgi:redox-sensitive bicupin YhaK (pirin superfamily)
MTTRTPTAIFEAPTGLVRPGFATRDAPADLLGPTLDPFLNLSLFAMSQPTFPPHPHAGFSVATYILPDSDTGFWNQDSRGHLNRIEPGALHWTVAGSGVLHEETVMRSGRQALGFQIWIDHRDAERDMAPDALHLAAADVPRIESAGVVARVVLGASNGTASPLKTPTPVRLIDVTADAGAAFSQDLEPGENAFVWVLRGDVAIAGQSAEAGEIVRLDAEGNRLAIHAGETARYVIFAGRPLRQRPVMQGPLVAANPARLAALFADVRAGRMGHLKGFDQAALDRAHDGAAAA